MQCGRCSAEDLGRIVSEPADELAGRRFRPQQAGQPRLHHANSTPRIVGGPEAAPDCKA